MREGMGLYRGKRLDNGEWVEGFFYYAHWINPTTRERVGTSYYILPLGQGDAFKVDPETIGQWTGLVDKKEVKIFEGDLVVPTNRRRLANKASVVEYDPLSGYWMCSPSREPLVIGNIHDKAVEE